MQIFDSVHKYEDVELDYKFSLPKRDRRHLIVVFSGGFVGGYDFDGTSFTRLGCSILWIRDKQNSYYIQRNGNNVFERGVQDLIAKKAVDFGIKRDQITLLGTSKGGAAALYHGLKYNYSNIVASVPRIYPARGNLDLRESIVKGILGNLDEDSIREFDSRISDLLQLSDNRKNLYIFSSPDDEQYKTEILPNLDKFRRFDNFNYVETSSTNVRQHEDVTLYNLPIISSILSMLIDGIRLKFGEVKNGNFANSHFSDRQLVRELSSRPIASIESLDLSDEGLFVKGRGFLMYRSAANYGDVRRRFILTNQNGNEIFSVQLGGLKDRRNNRDFEDGTGFDYLAGSYATVGSRPYPLNNLPYGVYSVSLEIIQDGKRVICDVLESKDLFFFRAIDDYVLQVNIKSGIFQLSKIPLVDLNEHSNSVELSKIFIEKGKLFIQGSCNFSNLSTPDWKDIQFKLALHESASGNTVSFVLGKNRSGISDFPWRLPDVDTFTTPNNRGINLSSLTSGEFRVILLCSVKEYTFVCDLRRTLSVSPTGLFEIKLSY